MQLEQADPKGLVRESYRIEGITEGECRSIFVDWALSLPVGAVVPAAAGRLIEAYAAAAPDHPMSVVLRQAQEAPPEPRRRGGRAARFAGS
ncbi:MAG: hypothetical protein A2092_06905 [Rhodobacteraceae bacterium GWE1_64_9]|nr:MAG: hypothetical protein A2092_06905 [Rhodobacteraceae bacterium GWE1_64_9]OHC50372.1 MAG: hypothetical protein A2X69_02680 [Rhodobacteraceae bacterium GWF1_65_7]HBD92412.1 hypothetical protein [Gemmobacter sp.]HBU15437.1 hypothetical protein [Gemmobacter sp.]